MSDPATLETVDQAAEPQSDLWTADSERAAIQTSDDHTPLATDTGIEAEPAGEAVAEPASAVGETTLDQPERDANGQFKGKKRPGNPRTDPQARVQQATAREAAAREEARVAREETARVRAELDAARESRAAATSKPAPQPQTAAGFQPYEQWAAQHSDAPYEDYLDERAEWRLDQRLSAMQQQQTEASRWQGHRGRLAAAVDADPSLPALIQTGTETIGRELQARGMLDSDGRPTLPPALLTAILDAPNSVDIYKYLLSHPTDAVQLAVDVRTLPAQAASVVRRLLDSHLATTAVPVPDSASVVRPSAARPPVNRVGGSASATPASPDDLDFGPEYVRQENARERKQREAGRW